MANLIKIDNQDREDGRTPDSKKYNKDCFDFENLNDGTILGDCRYCDLSLQCHQLDILPNGKTLPMEAHYLPIINPMTGELIEHALFCTGLYDFRPRKERLEDDKVS